MPVPEDRTIEINEIVEDMKFEIKTGRKIDQNYDIRWTMNPVGPFTFTVGGLMSRNCNNGYKFNGTEGFLKRQCVLSFLKTSTQLQIWYDDVLEVTWVYEDDDAQNPCAMRKTLTGLKFKTANEEDKVSIHYRYKKGYTIYH